MIKVFWGSLVKALVAVTLIAVSAAASLFFGVISLFYVLLVLFFGVFLWLEGRRKHPLAESKQAVYSRMLDKE